MTNESLPKERPRPFVERFAYACDVCKTKFNWDTNSQYYGVYGELDKSLAVPTFCCRGCADAYAVRHSVAPPIKKSKKS